ncbi:MAG: sigma-70 family RNA polymerase sigma factor [bacterium]
MAKSSSATAEGPFASIIGMGVSDENRASVNAALSGDSGAFEAIVSKYKGLVFHMVRSMIPDYRQHEDLAQDIFIRVYESLPRFRFRCSLTTWISRIAYNTCLNQLRRSKSHPQHNPDFCTGLEKVDEIEHTDGENSFSMASPTSYAVICHKEIAAAVIEAVEKLPRTDRLVITLHYLESFSLPELAESLGMPLGTVKSLLFRARAKLKNDLLQKFTIEDLLR